MKKKISDYINKRIKQEQEESVKWIDRVLNSESTEEVEEIIRKHNKKKYGV